jgi:predicted kinase
MRNASPCQLADALGAPQHMLVVMAGTTGSGKTTLARFLTSAWPSVRHLESDAVRKQIHGIPKTRRADVDDVFGSIYSAKSTEATYAEMMRIGAELLTEGMTVILDGSFRQRAVRAQALAIARQVQLPSALIVCSVDPRRQVARLENRYRLTHSVSDGRPEVLLLHNADWEPVESAEADVVVHVDTGATSVADSF